jgi:hypothetical protein
MDFSLDITAACANWYGALRKNIVVKEAGSGRFFLINHADQSFDMSWDLVAHPLCIGVLKCQYRDGDYERCPEKVSPFTYGVKEKQQYYLFRAACKAEWHRDTPMFFKGNESGRKNLLSRLVKMGLLNGDYGFRDGSGTRHLKVSQKEYLQRMASAKVVFSLPGIGNFCHRELEAFGIGVPVLMPVLKNRYYDPLVSDQHYIGIDTSDIGAPKIRLYTKEDEQLVCERIEKRYCEVVENTALLEQTAANAMRWFEGNIVFPQNMILLERILAERFGYLL